MKCPSCGSTFMYTLNSRPTKHATKVWRRKKCSNCKTIFTTYESVDLSFLFVIKKSGKVVRFKREKLFASIYKAAIQGKHVDHGEMSVLAEELTQVVEVLILNLKKKKILTSEIRDMVVQVLRKKNLNLLFRYLSYFENINKSQVLNILG